MPTKVEKIGTVVEGAREANESGKSHGFQFRRTRVKQDNRPLCPRDPHHRVWRRHRPHARAKAEWFCPECRLSVRTEPPTKRYKEAVVRDAKRLMDRGLSYRAAAKEVHRIHGIEPSPSTMYEWSRAEPAEVRRSRIRDWHMLMKLADSLAGLLKEYSERPGNEDLKHRADRLLLANELV